MSALRPATLAEAADRRMTGLSYADAMALAGRGATVTRPGLTVRVQCGVFVRVEPGFPPYALGRFRRRKVCAKPDQT